MTNAVVIRQRKPWRRKHGEVIYFEDNAGVIVNPKGEMKGERAAQRRLGRGSDRAPASACPVRPHAARTQLAHRCAWLVERTAGTHAPPGRCTHSPSCAPFHRRLCHHRPRGEGVRGPVAPHCVRRQLYHLTKVSAALMHAGSCTPFATAAHSMQHGPTPAHPCCHPLPPLQVSLCPGVK